MYVNNFIIYSSFRFYLNSQHFTLIFHKKTDMLYLTVIIKLFCEYKISFRIEYFLFEIKKNEYLLQLNWKNKFTENKNVHK